jgi:hypothetical protein
MQGLALAGGGHPSREGVPEVELVGERAQRVQPDVGCDLVAARFHHDATGTGSLHLGRALLFWVAGPSRSPVSLAGRAFPRMRGLNSFGYVNDRG